MKTERSGGELSHLGHPLLRFSPIRSTPTGWEVGSRVRARVFPFKGGAYAAAYAAAQSP